MKPLPRFDKRLLTAVGILVLFGLVALASASGIRGFNQYQDTYYFLKRQMLYGVVPGLIVGYIFWLKGYRYIERLAVPLLFLIIVLLIMVFVPGVGQSYGTFARRWIRLGALSFQPSELAKFIIVIYLAALFSRRHEFINDLKRGIMPFVGLTGLVVSLILLEPDLGTAGIITIIAFLMYFVAGGKIRYLIIMACSGLVVLGLLVVIEPYRLNRLTTFFDPGQDPQGIGYHVQQSYLAIGSGGLWGRGFGESRSKFQYLPEVTGDSIFPVIAEELGFFLSSALVILYVYIFWRAMVIARESPDLFGRYLASGLGIWICAQAFINLSSMVGLVPLTGVPLPFVSYGGTAMAALLISAGLLLSISKNQAESSNKKFNFQ